MWQVAAGVVGLSIAVAVFAFQGLAQGRSTRVLAESGAAPRLLSAVYLGVTGLLVNGLALLGLGRDAPAGWAALWATAVIGSSLVSLAFLLRTRCQR